MNELITDLKSLELETLKNLKNSKANNTLRAYQSDFKDFSAFCAKNGLSSIPTQPKVIAIYITHLSKSFKFSTFHLYLGLFLEGLLFYIIYNELLFYIVCNIYILIFLQKLEKSLKSER